MELKLDQPAEEALRQILYANYLQPFDTGKRKKIALEISFSSAKRKVAEYKVKEIFEGMLTKVIEECYHDQLGLLQQDKSKLIDEITSIKQRISYTRDLLAAQKIDPDDYREMKEGYVVRLQKLEASLASFCDDDIDLQNLIKEGVGNLFKLHYLYTTGDIIRKER